MTPDQNVYTKGNYYCMTTYVYWNNKIPSFL